MGKLRSATIVKSIAVPGEGTLSDEYKYAYVEDVDMYLFSSEVIYSPVWKHYFGGRRLMHDEIISKHKLKKLNQSQFNFITIDLSDASEGRTKLSLNRRSARLTRPQIEYIVDTFKVDEVPDVVWDFVDN